MTSGTTAFVYVTARVAAALIVGAAVGWFAGSVWIGVTGALALYLAWNLWQLRALAFWLQHRSVADPPNASGLWSDVVAQVVRLHRRKRFHKERLTRLFRELRRSTAAMPDGVVMLDPNGEIIWFNRKAGELLDQVWGDHVFIEERTVDVHIRRLRKALEPTGHDRLIDTVRGSGYGLRTD